MREPENELRKALAENGHYDAEKAGHDATQASRRFDLQLKWSGRLAWMRLILVVVVFEFAFVNFYCAASTKALIGYATLMVITMILVGVIGVQSWVASARIKVLREIKLLRLDGLGSWKAPAGYPEPANSPATTSKRSGLSVPEYIAWMVLLAVIAGASAYGSYQFSLHRWPASMARFEGAPVNVEAPPIGAPISAHVYLRMEQGQCAVTRLTREHAEAMRFLMGEGTWQGPLSPGDTLRLDPQGNPGDYAVRFE